MTGASPGLKTNKSLSVCIFYVSRFQLDGPRSSWVAGWSVSSRNAISLLAKTKAQSEAAQYEVATLTARWTPNSAQKDPTNTINLEQAFGNCKNQKKKKKIKKSKKIWAEENSQRNMQLELEVGLFALRGDTCCQIIAIVSRRLPCCPMCVFGCATPPCPSPPLSFGGTIINVIATKCRAAVVVSARLVCDSLGCSLVWMFGCLVVWRLLLLLGLLSHFI